MASPETLIITGVMTLSYPYLDKAKKSQDENGKDKFSATLVGAPGYDWTEMHAAALAAAIDKFGAKNGPKLVTVGGKGATFRNDVADKYPEGSIYINVNSDTQPGLVFGDLSRVPQEKIREVFYAGSQVKAQIRFYGYDNKGNKGIGKALNNLQFIGDGERLDNRMKAEDAFPKLNVAPADLAALGLA